MNRPIRRWHAIVFAICFILALSSTDCDGNCPAPQESRQ